ncbi:zincin [Myriangium duriaei CBS 260.36]|uniref:Zincin n=1 Tax=Myriangium duriaei CBS 260.36 TaxID=1168546 RepID=A0A9P4J8N8_9PEZI|nr:zincin [Myriangium duriaei CBS 260.36]
MLALVALLLLLLLLSTLTTAQTSISPRFSCPVNVSSADPSYLSAISSLSHGSSLTTISPRTPSQFAARTVASKSISIGTYFHIVSTAALNGTITPAMVSAQLAALNTAYAPYLISFRLLGTEYLVNDAWAAAANASALAALKTASRKGSYSTLNVYFHSSLPNGVLGTCTLPASLGTGKISAAVYAQDGCDVAAQSMPGGSITGYNAGKTAVHEVGHWLGLLHVFEGYACSGLGDYVSDTPVQSTATEGCPIKPQKDSCVGQGMDGVDAVHNYMDYSTDACYERFSTGQVQRMREIWGLFRDGK